VPRETLVLHILPIDLSRGAQTYAKALRGRLDRPEVRHRTVTLFASSRGALDPDVRLDAPPGLARRVGLDVRALRRLRRLVREERPDVVVAHGSEPLKYAVLAGVPRDRLVYYKIGVGGSLLRGPRRLLHRWLLRRLGTVAAVSEDAAREARNLGVDPARLRVIVNGRDPTAYRLRTPSASQAVVRLLFVGHLTTSKRPDVFVALVRALRAQGITVEAKIAGDGPMLDSMRRAGLDWSIDVLGRVDDVPALLAEGDVFVFTSMPEGEGMPGVLIEAGMSGLPVVATDVPGVSEVVEEGVTGFVVPVDDFDALVRGVSVLVDDGELRHRFGAAARARCEQRFSADASIGEWQALLAEVIRNRCTSSI
jgi:glycosyltransferase involved in cell wall biosynthesis